MNSSGVSAGVDTTLAAVAQDAARMLAQATEYERKEDAGRDTCVGNLDTAMPYVELMEAAEGEPSGSGR